MKLSLTVTVILVALSSCRSVDKLDRVRAPASSWVVPIVDGFLYRELLAHFPNSATRQGIHDHDRRLNDPSPEGWRRYGELLREALRRLEEIEAYASTTSENDALELALARLWLTTEIEGHEFRGTDFLIDPLHGFHIDLPRVFREMRYRNPADYDIAIERIGRIDEYVVGVTESLREQMAAGRFEAKPVVEKVIAQFDLQLEMQPNEHPFFATFTEFPRAISETARADIAKRALERLTSEVLPAWKDFRDFLVDDYLPKARTDVGVWATPMGARRYAWCVKRYTTTDLSPDEIHAIGLREVARIRSEMEKIRESVGFAGSLEEFFEHLRTDPRFYFTKPEDLLTGYRDICKRADAALPALFGKLPRAPYGVIPIPDFAARSATTAYYEVPPGDGSKPGYFYANTYRLEMRPKYEMEALALHEAVPGHHLQLALQIELENVSRFRSLWLEFTAFVEGWGLYSERLGLEMGCYEDPYSDFGRLTYEMWRACRLVVDTGMHHKHWSRERAIQLMLGNSALTRLNVESEIDRYITWPGQALAYKIGELKIRELRERAESTLQDAFDVRAFHDRVLEEGSLPLSILEQRILLWIRLRSRHRSDRDEGLRLED